jgi:uncharacterized membrane protein YgaE (UPF0421/DUF939 family)
LPGVRTAKYALAGLLAYAAAQQLPSSPRPVLAPLTALLVVQTTLYETLTSGLQRVASVVAGVLGAVGFSTLAGLSAWSVALVIVVGLTIGRLLRLGGNALEVPMSAMIVLAVNGQHAQAVDRVYETLVGAGVGVLVGAAIAPPL